MEELRGVDFHEVHIEEPEAISWCGFHPDAVICNKKECYRCGWHPKVEKMRKEKIRKEFADYVR